MCMCTSPYSLLKENNTVWETFVGRLKVQVYSKKERQKHTEKDIKDIKSSSKLTKYKHKWVMRQVALANYLIAHRVCFLFYFVYSIFTQHNSHRWGPPREEDMFLSSFFLTNSLF